LKQFQWVALAATAAMLFAAEKGRKEIPLVHAGGVVNGASFVPAPDNFVAPNSIVSIFGDDLALRTEAVTSDTLQAGRLPVRLGGINVRIGGQLAPLYFVSPTQINAQLPDSLTPRPQPWKLTVIREGLGNAPAAEADVHVRESAPGLFPVVAHVDFSLVGRGDPAGSRPAAPGEIVILFGTGFGPTQPPVDTGELPPFAASALLPHRVFLGGQELAAEQVLYFGQAPLLAGLQQVNIVLPPGLATGDYEVQVEVGGALSQTGVWIAVDAVAEER
jgi:uncharacterized protein (TIGR03437 family)